MLTAWSKRRQKWWKCFKHSPLHVFSLMVRRAEQWRQVALPNKWDKADTREWKETHWWPYVAHRCFHDMLALIKSRIIYLFMFVPYFTCSKKIGILLVHAIASKALTSSSTITFLSKPQIFTSSCLDFFFPIHNPPVSASQMYLVDYLLGPALRYRVAINLGSVQEQ